jgi:hypothetical protein
LPLDLKNPVIAIATELETAPQQPEKAANPHERNLTKMQKRLNTILFE